MPTPIDLVVPDTPALALMMRSSLMRDDKPTASAPCPPEAPIPAPIVVSPTAPTTSGIAVAAAAIAPCCRAIFSTERNCPIFAASVSVTPATTPCTLLPPISIVAPGLTTKLFEMVALVAVKFVALILPAARLVIFAFPAVKLTVLIFTLCKLAIVPLVTVRF